MKIPILRALSSLFGNMAAAWYFLALVTPGFSNLFQPGSLVVLTRDIFAGTVFLLLAVMIEKKLQDERFS